MSDRKARSRYMVIRLTPEEREDIRDLAYLTRATNSSVLRAAIAQYVPVNLAKALRGAKGGGR